MVLSGHKDTVIRSQIASASNGSRLQYFSLTKSLITFNGRDSSTPNYHYPREAFFELDFS